MLVFMSLSRFVEREVEGTGFGRDTGRCSFCNCKMIAACIPEV
jgi:hypothetical protein